jgi:hypothetical protein
MEVVMDMKKCIGLSLVCGLVVWNGAISPSAVWAGCTVQERIELGKQGYDKSEVEKTCADDGKNDDDNFWETLSKNVMTGFANGLTDSLTKGLNNALVGRDRDSSASVQTPDEARVCVTDVGMCPLSGGPTGAQCYCQAWNGATFYGFSK